jgi:peptidoglycan/xylan/chitin deacetylase (PgdA/CDA1 family)
MSYGSSVTPWSRFNGRLRAILTYHSIDSSGSPISVDRAAFARHVHWLASDHVRVVSIADLLSLPEAEDAVAVTFDDGFRDFREVAWPYLRDNGLPVTLFVATDRVGATNQWTNGDVSNVPTLPLLDWREIAQLAGDGVTIASHSRSHPDLRGLSSERLTDEIAGSARAMEQELGLRPEGFAYPYGLADRAAVETVATVYDWACTTEFRPLPRSPRVHELPRLDAYYFRGADFLNLWGTVPFRGYVWLRGNVRRVGQAVRLVGRRR